MYYFHAKDRINLKYSTVLKAKSKQVKLHEKLELFKI